MPFSIRQTGAALGSCFLVVVTIIWFVNKTAKLYCPVEDPSDSNLPTIRASKVVVQPWIGQHHVYAIFMVPDQYKHKKYAVSITAGGINYCFLIDKRSELEYVDHVSAPHGHYVLQIYLPTRVALWFIFYGQLGNLKAPFNWALLFVDRVARTTSPVSVG